MGARDVTNEKFFLQLINTSTQPQDVVSNGLPNSTLTLLRSRSGENNITVGNYNPSNGALTITIPADSVSALTGALSVPGLVERRRHRLAERHFQQIRQQHVHHKSQRRNTQRNVRLAAICLAGPRCRWKHRARVDPGNGTAGLMIRESNATGAKMVALMLDSSGNAIFITRSSAGASSSSSQFNANTPYYLRLSRSGNTFTAALSANGSSFANVAQIDIAMSGTARIGMAVTSGTGSFTQVQVSANAPSAAPDRLTATASQEKSGRSFLG
jgi:hypothetical protein